MKKKFYLLQNSFFFFSERILKCRMYCIVRLVKRRNKYDMQHCWHICNNDKLQNNMYDYIELHIIFIMIHLRHPSNFILLLQKLSKIKKIIKKLKKLPRNA